MIPTTRNSEEGIRLRQGNLNRSTTRVTLFSNVNRLVLGNGTIRRLTRVTRITTVQHNNRTRRLNTTRMIRSTTMTINGNIINLISSSDTGMVVQGTFRPNNTLRNLRTTRRRARPYVRANNVYLFRHTSGTNKTLRLIHYLFRRLATVHRGRRPIANTRLVNDCQYGRGNLTNTNERRRRNTNITILPLNISTFANLLLMKSRFLPRRGTPYIRP